MRCEFRSENGSCQLLFPPKSACAGEDDCTHYQLEAEKVCPSCNNKGASWSGYAKHGGFSHTCWNCGHIWDEPFVRLKTPGICLRCERKFDNPVPEVTYPEGYHEIACIEWCADCNALTVAVIFRGSTAYKKFPLFDPTKTRGGRYASS